MTLDLTTIPSAPSYPLIYGVQVTVFPFDTVNRLEVWRAPDNGSGAPNDAASVQASILPPGPLGGVTFIDPLPNDNAKRYYKSRHVDEAGNVSAFTAYSDAGIPVLVTGTGIGSIAPMAAFGAIVDAPPPNTKYEMRMASTYTDPDFIDGMQSYIDFAASTNFMRLGTPPKLVEACVTSSGLIKVQITAHGYVTNQVVTIRGHLGVTNANGTFAITKVDANNFTLNGSTFAGVDTPNTGHCSALSLRIKPDGTLIATRLLSFAEDGLFAVRAATSDGIQADRSVQIAGQTRTLLQTLTYEVPNAEFDIWETSAQPNAWTVDTGDSSVAAQETSVVFAGDNALKYSFGAGGSAGTFRGITTNDPTKGAFCIPLHPGTWYQFKFASRVTSTTNAPSYKVTLTHDVGGTLISTATFTYRLANKWQLDYFKFLVPATAEARTRLAIEFSRGATTALDFYVDGVRLQDKGTQRTVILTTGTSWAVPSDFNPADNTVECWGGGGGGGGGSINVGSGGGGGGGEYRKKRNFDPGSLTSITVALGGGGTFGGAGVAGGAGGDTTFNTSTVVAKGGGGGAGGASGTAGNAGSGGTGPDGNNNGGSGGTGSTGTGNRSAGAGGGAGGPSAVGGAGGNGVLNPVAGTTGGNAGGPSGGTGGTGSGAGTNGSTYSSTDDGTSAGGGGGGGGGQAGGGGNGGNYGGAGGGGGSTAGSSGAGNAGHGGVIVISWRTP